MTLSMFVKIAVHGTAVELRARSRADGVPAMKGTGGGLIFECRIV